MPDSIYISKHIIFVSLIVCGRSGRGSMKRKQCDRWYLKLNLSFSQIPPVAIPGGSFDFRAIYLQFSLFSLLVMASLLNISFKPSSRFMIYASHLSYYYLKGTLRFIYLETSKDMLINGIQKRKCTLPSEQNAA